MKRGHHYARKDDFCTARNGVSTEEGDKDRGASARTMRELSQMGTQGHGDKGKGKGTEEADGDGDTSARRRTRTMWERTGTSIWGERRANVGGRTTRGRVNY